MELDEMKVLWNEMSTEVEKQKTLTSKLILEMTEQKFNNKLRKISIPESIGAVICFLMALFVLVNFNKLDTWYFLVSGVFTVAYLVLIPLFVLKSISDMKGVNISENNYKQTIQDFAKSKKRFFLLQQLSQLLGVILIITSMLLSAKILNDKDLFVVGGKALIWAVPLLVIFLYFFSRWGIKCYRNATVQAEDLLRELDNS